MRTYTPELKAQVIAEWALGASLNGLSKKHGIPRSTVQRWTNMAERALPIPQNVREDLGQLVYDYLAAGLKALIAQSRVMADDEWFKGQGETAHLIHGTLADKLVIIFQGVENGQSEPTQLPSSPSEDR